MYKQTSRSIIAFYCYVTLIGFTLWKNVWADTLLSNGHCQIIFSLKGGSQTVFENQAQQLAHHIERLGITLIDLNKIHESEPYTDLSGRERRRLKQDLTLTSDESTALVRVNHLTIFKTSGSIDLTLLIQTCQQHLYPD